ncbi:MAG TPA: flagellar biosynthesis protein FlhA [Acidimicrobiia bacterium]|nr:flagellar biosynthesis protein FlhA [Acidimicrobiia bacterium]
MRSTRLSQIGVPAAVVAIVVMMVVPLPTVLLDLLLVCNLAGATVILLVSMHVRRSLDFSIFPSLLLIATLFRLALNVSSTRLVLLHGDAGKVIESFGHFVVGGSVVVGLVIFLILSVIQFIVITNGAGRVAEVGARFTLDAMPGKQMAIDADLNSGLISEDEARRRRREVAAEADFYGAMDGASKFVKGDAIAGLLITFINLFGGFIIGVVQHHLSISEAINRYSLLSVGDGLVSQIPALLISIASGLVVTRAATEADMGTDLLSQLGRQEGQLRLAGACIGLMAVVPGLPKIPFLAVGAALWIASSRVKDANAAAAAAEAAALSSAGAGGAAAGATGLTPDTPEELAATMRVEPLELEIGIGLMDLADTARGGDLLDRVRALRRKVAMELGIVIPPVRTRDNLDLPPSAYAIRVHGVELARGEAPGGSVLVLGERPPGVPGTPTRDPVFGLDASWVPAEFGPQAELAGATVVDRGSVVTAHMAEVVRNNAGRLLSRQDVKMLVDAVRSTDPVVADEFGAAGLTLAEVQRVLQGLLEEVVPIRDLVRILEVLSERSRVTKDPEVLTEAVRVALGPSISAGHAPEGKLPVLTLEPVLEHALLESLRPSEAGSYLALDPEIAERLLAEVGATATTVEQQGRQPVLVCAAPIRPALRRLVRNVNAGLPVLSYLEIGRQLELESMGVVSLVPATV